MYHNEEAVLNGCGFRHGEETYEDYHVAATDKQAEGRADYNRRMAQDYHDQQVPPAPVPQDDPQADGRGAESGCRGLPRSGNHVSAASTTPGETELTPGVFVARAEGGVLRAKCARKAER